MSTFIAVPNDWDLELRAAVKLALAEACPWYVTQRQREAIVRRVMARAATVLPLGGGGPIEPTGGAGPVEQV